MNVQQQSIDQYSMKADRMRAVFAPKSGARFQELQQKAAKNDPRNRLGQKHTFKLTGGSKLEVQLDPGMNPDKPNDKLMKLLDKAAEGKNFGNERLMLKNTDPNAKLNYAPKNLKLHVTGNTFKELPKYGKIDIEYHNTMGVAAASKHGEAKLTLSGATDISHSKIGQGNLNLNTVGGETRGIGIEVSKNASLTGTLPAHATNANIIGGKDYGVAGTNANVAGATLSGKTAPSVARIERTMEEFGAAMNVSKGYNLGVSMMPKRPEGDTSAFQASNRRNKLEQLAA